MDGEQREALAGKVVIFSLAGEEYALPVGRVQEIVRYVQPRRIGASVPWVQGVISLRGRILAVCDLGARFGIPGAPGSDGVPLDDAKIVVVEAANGVAGIVVAAVTEVMTLTAEQCEPLPTAGDGCRRGIAKLGDRLVALLDPDRLLDGAVGDGTPAAAA